jgi:hypothetical protein
MDAPVKRERQAKLELKIPLKQPAIRYSEHMAALAMMNAC